MTHHKEREDTSDGYGATERTAGSIFFVGGRLTPGIVCVGNTVHWPGKANAAFVHDLLLGLQDQNFPFAPHFLGMDEQGREILRYLKGEIWPDSGSGLSDDLLVQAARAIRRYHNATTAHR